LPDIKIVVSLRHYILSNLVIMDKLRLCFIRRSFYFFGVDRSIPDEYRSRSDVDRLAEDWRKAGEDIRKVYDKRDKKHTQLKTLCSLS
jgi:hypothetical protein